MQSGRREAELQDEDVGSKGTGHPLGEGGRRTWGHAQDP